MKKKALFVFLLSLFAVAAISQSHATKTNPGANEPPRINGAKVFGIRPNAPLLFKIAATGTKPLLYKVSNLPEGVTLDEKTGILSGKLTVSGDYKLKVAVSNNIGTVKSILTIKVGAKICLTPPMGWNSWNAFGLGVTQEKVKAAAQAFIDKGLIDHGWTYINIDDGWEAAKRNNDSILLANEKFPDMKGLADWLHSQGLKFGIYSSPGDKTCGGYLGSYKNEIQDATTYTAWGVDYLKYDLCSYKWDIFDKEKDNSEAAWMRPFLTMRKCLDQQNRDIVYSICSYNSTTWAPKVGANLTRLTGDGRDTWEAILNGGFTVDKFWETNNPGLWNDADMLVVGNLGGWEDKYRPTRLTKDEQYTHISLWCLLATPLLIGCDMATIDDFTISLLTNDELIDINQDPLGKQGRQLIKNNDYQVWVKGLEDGTNAVGIFNMSNEEKVITVKWSDISITGKKVRDLWQHKELGKFKKEFTTTVAPHGVTMLKVR